MSIIKYIEPFKSLSYHAPVHDGGIYGELMVFFRKIQIKYMQGKYSEVIEGCKKIINYLAIEHKEIPFMTIEQSAKKTFEIVNRIIGKIYSIAHRNY